MSPSPAIERVTFTEDNTTSLPSSRQKTILVHFEISREIRTRTHFQQFLTNVITYKERRYPRHYPALNNEKFNDVSTIIDM